MKQVKLSSQGQQEPPKSRGKGDKAMRNLIYRIIFLIGVCSLVFYENLSASETWVACVNYVPEPKAYPIVAEKASVTNEKDFFSFSFCDEKKLKRTTTIRLEKENPDEYQLTKASGTTMGVPFIGDGKVTERDEAGKPIQFEITAFKVGDDGKPDKSVRGLYIFIRKLE
jgi:hypothetical protein